MIKYESYPKALRVVFYAIVNRSDNNNSYDCYGKNNITLSPAWKNNPELFFNWAIKNGWEQGKHIHRKNNQDGYNENNCEILSAQEHHCIHSKKPCKAAPCSYLDNKAQVTGHDVIDGLKYVDNLMTGPPPCAFYFNNGGEL